VKFGEKSRFHLVPDSDHNMHMDNPQAFANIVINDLLDLEGAASLPILSLEQQGQD